MKPTVYFVCSVLLSLTTSITTAFIPSVWWQQRQPHQPATMGATRPISPGLIPFVCQRQQQRPPTRAGATRKMSSSSSSSQDDEQPTMDEIILYSADTFIETMTQSLGEGVEPPPELAALVDARDSGASINSLGLGIFELMIERGMCYNRDPETGILTPTNFDISSNLNVKEVQDEFAYLYDYGMSCIENGLLTMEQVETAVKERLVDRTGLSPQEFDTWLGY
jgi:hypothetical protein